MTVNDEVTAYIYPHVNYRGDCTPELNREMQDFANTVLYHVYLETNGKITCDQAYTTIKKAYKRLKKSKKKKARKKH